MNLCVGTLKTIISLYNLPAKPIYITALNMTQNDVDPKIDRYPVPATACNSIKPTPDIIPLLT